MYKVLLEDIRGNHPNIDISEVKKCIVSCLKSDQVKSDPASIEDLRERLAIQLRNPTVMGNTFRYQGDHDNEDTKILLLFSAVFIKSAEAYRAYNIDIFSQPWSDPSGRSNLQYPLKAFATRKSVSESVRQMHEALIAREAIEGPGHLPLPLKERMSNEDRQSDDVKGEIKTFHQLSPVEPEPCKDPSGRNKHLHPLNALAVRKSISETVRQMHEALTTREAIEGPGLLPSFNFLQLSPEIFGGQGISGVSNNPQRHEGAKSKHQSLCRKKSGEKSL